MTRYHVNPETGRVGKCEAPVGKCPHGEQTPHGGTRKEARKAYENKQTIAGKNITKDLSKSKIRRNTLRDKIVKNDQALMNNFSIEHDDNLLSTIANRYAAPALEQIATKDEIVINSGKDFINYELKDSTISVRKINSAVQISLNNNTIAIVPQGSPKQISETIVNTTNQALHGNTNFHNANSKSSILADMDGTIVKGSLVLDHAVYLHENNICDYGDLPERWAKDPKNDNIITELAEAYKESLAGKTLHDIHASDYIKSIAHNKKKFYSSLHKINNLKAQGTDVMVISGSPSYLVEAFAKEHGFTSTASEYEMVDGVFTGEVAVPMFNHKAKENYLRSLDLSEYNHVIAYGDTHSDKPLFDKANFSVLVNPHDMHRQKLASVVDKVIED